MSTSTNGEISYGVLFEEDFEFPWNAEEFESDLEEWWRSVNGYVPPFEPYEGNNILDSAVREG